MLGHSPRSQQSEPTNPQADPKQMLQDRNNLRPRSLKAKSLKTLIVRRVLPRKLMPHKSQDPRVRNKSCPALHLHH
jgi:hypothetical protein